MQNIKAGIYNYGCQLIPCWAFVSLFRRIRQLMRTFFQVLKLKDASVFSLGFILKLTILIDATQMWNFTEGFHSFLALKEAHIPTCTQKNVHISTCWGERNTWEEESMALLCCFPSLISRKAVLISEFTILPLQKWSGSEERVLEPDEMFSDNKFCSWLSARAMSRHHRVHALVISLVG